MSSRGRGEGRGRAFRQRERELRSLASFSFDLATTRAGRKPNEVETEERRNRRSRLMPDFLPVKAITWVK